MAETTRRVLRLLSLLEARSVWSGPELALRLGVTTRTVRRDVERLRELGYPVEGEQGVDGGYRLGRGMRLPPLVLDDDEAVAVAVGLRTAAGSSVAGAGEAAVRALGKLDQVLPAALRDRVRALAGVLSVQDADGTVDADALVALASAVRGLVRARFDYLARDGTVSRRDVEPRAVVTTGRRWYLYAFDPARDDWRTFRLDRMADVTATTWRFKPRPGPEPAAAVRAAVRHHGGAHRLVVRYAASADVVQPWVERAGGRASDLEAGGCEVTIEVDDLPEAAWHFARIALRLGADLDVVSPPELRVELVRLSDHLATWGGQPVSDGG